MDVIIGHYSESIRSYHTTEHLQVLLFLADLFSEDIQDRTAVALSILFHDVIYDPTSPSNEEDSAKLFQEFCEQAGPTLAPYEPKVVKWILQTKRHHNLENPDTTEEDEKLFLDFDLAILGCDSFDEYNERYAKGVRREYGHIEDASFAQKRAAFLRSFLEHPFLFHSELVRTRLEEVARRNVEQEIEMLEDGFYTLESLLDT